MSTKPVTITIYKHVRRTIANNTELGAKKPWKASVTASVDSNLASSNISDRGEMVGYFKKGMLIEE